MTSYPGDLFLAEEATGGDSITTTPFDADWDTIDEENENSYSYASSAITVEAGYHLVIYNEHIGAGGTGRVQVETLLELNGTDLDYGRGSGYVRQAGGQSECEVNGATIIYSAGSYPLQLEITRTDSNGAATATRGAAGGGIQVIKLDSNDDFARYTRTSTYTASTTSFQAFKWNSIAEQDTTSFQRSALLQERISIRQTGKILCAVNIRCYNSSTTNRVNAELRVRWNNVVQHGRVTEYLRGAQGCQYGSLVWVGIIDATLAPRDLEVSYRHNNTGAGTFTPQAECGLTLWYIGEDPDFALVSEAGGGQAADVDGAILFDTNDQVDTDTYTHSTSTSTEQISTKDPHVILTTYSVYNDRSAGSGVDRLYHEMDLRINGTAEVRGGAGAFNRGVSISMDCQQAGCSGGYLGLLDATDYIDLYHTDASTGTDTNCDWVAGETAIQCVNLSQYFAQNVSADPAGYTTAPVAVSGSFDPVPIGQIAPDPESFTLSPTDIDQSAVPASIDVDPSTFDFTAVDAAVAAAAQARGVDPESFDFTATDAGVSPVAASIACSFATFTFSSVDPAAAGAAASVGVDPESVVFTVQDATVITPDHVVSVDAVTITLSAQDIAVSGAAASVAVEFVEIHWGARPVFVLGGLVELTTPSWAAGQASIAHVIAAMAAQAGLGAGVAPLVGAEAGMGSPPRLQAGKGVRCRVEAGQGGADDTVGEA